MILFSFIRQAEIAKGKLMASSRLAVDITTRKEAAELAIKEKSARETAKLRSEFLASVSHELRTPLNAILGLSELLLHIVSPPLVDEQYNNVESIHSSGSLTVVVLFPSGYMN
jgi:signal transduction histidine kinase